MTIAGRHLLPYLDDYAGFHRRCSENIDGTKVLIFSTESVIDGRRKWVGGFADRIKGMLSSALLAILTERVFFAEWKTPTQVSDYLLPSAIQWLPTELLADRSAYLTIDAIDNDKYRSFMSALISNDTIDFSFENFQYVRIHSNILNFHDLLSRPQFLSRTLFGRALLARIGDVGLQRTITDLMVLLFSHLFKYTPSHVARPLWLDYERRRALGVPCIGVHFRTGGDGKWWDPQLDHIESLPRVVSKVHSIADQCFSNSAQIIVTSDSQLARDILLDKLSKIYSCHSYTGNIAHYERSNSLARDDFDFLLFEFMCLSRCDYVIHGAGEYALTAARIGGTPHSSYKD